MTARLSTVVVGALVGALLAAGPGFAGTTASPPAVDRAAAASGWLARQMVDGNHFEDDFGGVAYPDQGLTIDAVFAYAASHASGAASSRAMAWLAQPDILSGYIGDTTDESYAGATAKSALAVEVTGGNPRSFGGVDLISVLRGLELPSGQFADRSAYGDFSNAFSQSLAILALARTPGGAPAAASAFLASTRCADGGYPLEFGQPTCASDVDSTALAAQALQASGRAADAAAGINWLVSAQAADGGFASAGDENANSTGLAAQALWNAGRLLPAAKAAAFLRTLQSGCSAPADQRGAVAFDATGFDESAAQRATTQAVLGLARAGFAHLTSAGSRPGDPILLCPTS